MARLAHSRGESVVVASRQEGAHPGWWRRCEVGGEGRFSWMPSGVHLVFAIGPAAGEAFIVGAAASKLLTRIARNSPASLVVALPAGAVGQSESVQTLARAAAEIGASTVAFGPLFGVGDKFLSRHMMELRSGGNVRLPKVSPVRMLCADDAARVVVSARSTPEHITATGQAEIGPESAIDALISRFGGTRSSPLFGTGLPRPLRDRLLAWSDLADEWDETRFGPRLSYADWVDRLPGPRRRVGDAPATAPAR